MKDSYEDFKDILPDWVETEEDFENYKIKHSAEHVFAQAVKELYGDDITLAVAHITKNSFSNDSHWKRKVSEEDFEEIEVKMKEIIKRNLPIIRRELPIEEVKKLFKDNPYKLEWIEQFAGKEKTLTVYETGDQYVDFCKGPHVNYTKKIKAFKLLRIAGAYWRGDENNEMLTRIYGTAFAKKASLEEYLHNLELAEQNNHRKIGAEMELYKVFPEIGQGLPVWLPNGFAMRRVLEDYMYALEHEYNYVHTLTPHINRKELFETSGHLGFYDESMYSPIEVDDEVYYLKPMNCPAGMQVYSMKPRSYRELPYKLGEFGTVYRYEQSGELQGLQRVRGFTQNDAHIFCTPEQLDAQFMEVLEMLERFYRDIGFTNYRYRLSLSDAKKDKYVGDRSQWLEAEEALRKVLKKHDVDYYEAPGEAAFYGPKLDIQAFNVFGKEDSISTVQVDFNLPERFDLNYINEKGEQQRPYVIHRALIGSFERFFAFLIEHYGGKFPLWFAPQQFEIIPVSEKFMDYSYEVEKALRAAGRERNLWIRTEVNTNNERLGAMIRDSELKKVPYTLIVGGEDAKNKTVSVRARGLGDLGAQPLDQFVNQMIDKVHNLDLDLKLK